LRACRARIQQNQRDRLPGALAQEFRFPRLLEPRLAAPIAQEAATSRRTAMSSGKGNKKQTGEGSQGKGTGTGAMSNIDPERVPDNMVLSNRDKAQHSKTRGQDSKDIETEQLRDHAANRYPQDEQ
jgi:hypothetical protein